MLLRCISPRVILVFRRADLAVGRFKIAATTETKPKIEKKEK
jgi:hypothetical protein